MKKPCTIVLAVMSCLPWFGCASEESTSGVDAPECASGLRWTGGEEESPQMHPGWDCISCHQAEGEGPQFDFAGTVYATAHEPDDCFGVEGAVVEITDADGMVFDATTNRAGNFYLSAGYASPFTARVVYEGRTMQMGAEQVSGSCASCHTSQGANGAPGRVVAP